MSNGAKFKMVKSLKNNVCNLIWACLSVSRHDLRSFRFGPVINQSAINEWNKLTQPTLCCFWFGIAPRFCACIYLGSGIGLPTVRFWPWIESINHYWLINHLSINHQLINKSSNSNEKKTRGFSIFCCCNAIGKLFCWFFRLGAFSWKLDDIVPVLSSPRR